MEYIYVISKSGQPLMPTKRAGHVRKLLRRGKAKVVEHVPFVIQLLYSSPCITQPLFGGTDPGRTNIGNAVMTADGTVVYKDHVSARNRDIARLMSERRAHRQASRRGERLARKRLARRLGTTMNGLMERRLPGYGKAVKVKDIINTEARFNNRKRPAGWVTPSVRHLVQTHVNMVRRIRKFLPVDNWTLEINKFAFMLLDDGTVRGIDFQNGKLRGYRNVKDYIFHLQDGKCLCCGEHSIEHYHHMTPKYKGGSDRWYNLAGLCTKCHDRIHKKEISLSAAGQKRRYAGTSVLNQSIPRIVEELERIILRMDTCTGMDTARIRERAGIEKTHADDAVCIAAYGAHAKNVNDDIYAHEVTQFRRHDRANIRNQRERTYFLPDRNARSGYRIVARNRKPRYEQSGHALSKAGLTREQISTLRVRKSTRYYNTPDRLMPGAEFLYDGKRYVMTGQLTGGKYLRAEGEGTRNFPVARCTILKRNRGLVYTA